MARRLCAGLIVGVLAACGVGTRGSQGPAPAARGADAAQAAAPADSAREAARAVEAPMAAALDAAGRAALAVRSLEVRPERLELRVGQAFELAGLEVKAVDSAGRPVEGVGIVVSPGSAVIDLEDGTVVGVSPGEGELLVTVARARAPAPGAAGPPVARVAVVVRPKPVARVEVAAPATTLYAGTAVRLAARALTEDGEVREDVAVEWASGRPEVASVGPAGFVRGLRPGRVTIRATAGGVVASVDMVVEVNPIRSLDLAPASVTVGTGDVVRFEAVARAAGGRAVTGAPVTFTVAGLSLREDLGASIYADGVFVAERPGLYRVVASAGPVSAEAVVKVEARDVRMKAVRVAQGLVRHERTSDLWVFRGTDGRDYAYSGTWGGDGKMYAWDVTDPASPVLRDSVQVDARTVNDVKVNGAGTLAVITREGASNRRNGIVLVDVADPAHPTVAGEYTETLSGGVHNTFIVGDLVYAVHNGTRDVHIIDVSDPANAREVGRWGLDKGRKYLHDVWVADGLAYVSYWDDGVWILDAGDGRWGGTPTQPKPVSHYRYPEGNTHAAFPYTNHEGRRYLFVADEIFGCDDCITRGGPVEDASRGFVHVISLEDIENPVEVGRYHVPEAGAHNLWAEQDRLFVAYYQAGLRVVDIAGELRGDLYQQGREIAWFPTGSPDGYAPNSPMAWGPQPYWGNIFVSDHNSGLWVVRLEPERKQPVLP